MQPISQCHDTLEINLCWSLASALLVEAGLLWNQNSSNQTKFYRTTINLSNARHILEWSAPATFPKDGMAESPSHRWPTEAPVLVLWNMAATGHESPDVWNSSQRVSRSGGRIQPKQVSTPTREVIRKNHLAFKFSPLQPQGRGLAWRHWPQALLPFRLLWTSIEILKVTNPLFEESSACMPSRFTHVRLFSTLETVAHQTPLSIGFFQGRILEWAAVPSTRESSWPRDWTHVSYVSCISRQFLYH